MDAGKRPPTGLIPVGLTMAVASLLKKKAEDGGRAR
jgi:hypothetical protein